MTQNIRKYDDEGRLHCDDGPAVIYPNGYQEWWHNDKIHRVDGPAVIYSNGDQEWYRYGINITDIIKEWCSARGIDVTNLSDYDRQEIKIFMASL